jgi:uncharacterized protein
LTWKAKNNIIYRLSRNSSRLKRISDSFAFAKEGRVLEGTLAVSELERLHDLLTDLSGELAYRLEGAKDGRGHYTLRLQVTGEVALSCLRCLKDVHLDLDVDNLLELIPEGAELSQDELEDDTRDFLPVAGELLVADLVEDEVLLALPAAPRHEKCGLPGADKSGERITPFAGLAGLKGKPN